MMCTPAKGFLPLMLAFMLAPALALPAAGQIIEVDAKLPVYRRVSGVSGNLNSVGSDTLNNLMTLWAEAFRKVHGKALGLRFRCHRCNGPITEEMSYCPWCGSQGNSFSELTRFPLVCPECERGVRPEWNSCPWCYAGRFESNGRPPPHDPAATRRCSKRGCAGQLRPFMRCCPLCKQKPRRAWSHPDLPHRCPRCRWPTSHEFMRFCPWCGRKEPRAGSFTRYRE